MRLLRNKSRCKWATKESFHKYHDTEWGVPIYEDKKLFEMLILEGAQAGLSWETILKRRGTYRKAYKNFDPKIVAKFTELDKRRLLVDKGIIRNKLKIKASILNAGYFLEIQKEYGSFSNYIWSFTDNKITNHKVKEIGDIPANNNLSDTISEDLKKKGFKFVGSTIIYAYIEAIGIINDHEISCFRYLQIKDNTL
ncbi:DNA-3-methyladenine glycosylase I [Candidatus Woesearchaeota archaeon]|jgi:DNA-3-methyladenine glycosylase I|nr:DNA-3-methyladenine glycosylase I [Candidatus Woesearchaeota archaeon]